MNIPSQSYYIVLLSWSYIHDHQYFSWNNTKVVKCGEHNFKQYFVNMYFNIFTSIFTTINF